MGHLVRLTCGKADIVSPASATLEDRDVRTWLSDLDVSADSIEKARVDSQDLATRYPLAAQIGSSVFLYTVSKYPPAKPEALKTVSRSKRLRGRYRGPAKQIWSDG